MAPPAEFTLDMNASPPDPVATAAAVAEEAARKANDAGLMKRIQIFLEATVKMVSTVFLAACVSLAKMDMRDRPLVVILLSVVACLSLVVAIVSLVLITWPNRFPDKLYGWCMLLIHGCGVLLMVVVYLALRLISEDFHAYTWGIILVFGICTLCLCFYFMSRGHARGAFEDSVHQKKHLDKFENWVDFLAATTFLLFLGFGALLIGGQYRSLSSKDKEAMLVIIYLSFFICIAGVLLMLVCIGLVPPVHNGICDSLHIANNVFGYGLALIVLLTTLERIGGCWCVPSLVFLLSILPHGLWLVLACQKGAIGSRGDDELKPASLDLTKGTCTGFLAISAYTISQNTPVSIGNYYSWFIFFTAIAVNNSICWRLFTHHKKPSAARFTATNCAFLCAHVYAIAAVIPFGFMAYHAFNKKTSPAPSCHAPSPAPA